MTRALTTLVVVASLAGGGALLVAQAPRAGGGRDVRQQVSGSATIRGRIVTADSGAPIRRAQVRAVSAGTRMSRLATTDAEGRFEFRDLPAGQWEVSASKAGFVTLRFGQRRPFESGRPVELRDAQAFDAANIALPRGAAITGRVFDEFGDPVAGARLQVLRYQMVQGTRRLSPTGVNDQSDDTGAFRLFGLTPGDYYVSATLRALPVDDPTADAAGYAPTYYPGTGNVAEAQRITVGIGQELAVSFALLPVRTVRVAGSVVDSTGKPLMSGFVMLETTAAGADQPINAGGGGVVRDGGFTMTNVAPGEYAMTVVSRLPGGRGPARGAGVGGDAGEIAVMPLTVGTEDVTGLHVTTSKGATLSGGVVAAAGSGLLPPRIEVTAQAVSASRALGGRVARVEANGTFRIVGLLGTRTIRVGGLPQDWMLESVTSGGTDVTDRAIDFSSGQEVRDVRIVLTDRVTEVTGTVSVGSELAREYSVLVFPDDETRWAFPTRYVRAARPDQQGVFRLRGLPPGGGYLAVAVDYLEEGEGSDPLFLAHVRERATRFAVGPGEAKTLGLKLVER